MSLVEISEPEWRDDDADDFLDLTCDTCDSEIGFVYVVHVDHHDREHEGYVWRTTYEDADDGRLVCEDCAAEENQR